MRLTAKIAIIPVSASEKPPSSIEGIRVTQASKSTANEAVSRLPTYKI